MENITIRSNIYKTIIGEMKSHSYSMDIDLDSDNILNIFSSLYDPPLSFRDYINRFLDYESCESVFVYTLIYMKRFILKHSTWLHKRNVHRIFFSAYITAVKFLSDEVEKMSWYAYLGGMILQEIHRLEKEFIKSLDWNLYVTSDEYQVTSRYIKI